MSKRVLIAGCGYVGTALALELCDRGDAVWALRRSKQALEDLKVAGILDVQADITKAGTLRDLPDVDWVVICVAPRRPPLEQTAPNESSVESYREIYFKGVGNLLKALCASRNDTKILYISSTSVYGQENGEWVDENSPTEPNHETGKILVEAEKQALNSGLPTIILRLGGIYGPERNRISYVKEGKTAIERADDYINLIHLTDVVQASIFLLEKGKLGEIYLGVDDKPVTRREYFLDIAEMLGVAPPAFKQSTADSFLTGQSNKRCRTDRSVPNRPFGAAAPSARPALEQAVPLDQAPDRRSNKQCRNQKLKSLGFEFTYPTFREGYRELISV